MAKVKLGEKYRDPLTGFEGMAVGKTTWLYGCARIALQGLMDKDGKIPDHVWFDELQLINTEPDKEKGGPSIGSETG